MSRRRDAEETKMALHGVVEEMYDRLNKGEAPTMTLPDGETRSLDALGTDDPEQGDLFGS